MAATSVLLDPGPIPYREIELFGDPDLEHGLRHLGLEPAATAYRLVEVPVGAIDTTRGMANWTWTPRSIIEAMKRGQELLAGQVEGEPACGGRDPAGTLMIRRRRVARRARAWPGVATAAARARFNAMTAWASQAALPA
jgi:hypothetical protein